KTCKYNARGKEIEWAFFGLDGKPSRHTDGNARGTARYDERGNELERAFFGVDGKPTLLKDGYARVAHTYDRQGSPISARYFGSDGRPVRTVATVETITPGGPAAKVGLRVGDVCLRYDGKPVVDRSLLRAWQLSPGSAHRVLEVQREGKRFTFHFPP